MSVFVTAPVAIASLVAGYLLVLRASKLPTKAFEGGPIFGVGTCCFVFGGYLGLWTILKVLGVEDYVRSWWFMCLMVLIAVCSFVASLLILIDTQTKQPRQDDTP